MGFEFVQDVVEAAIEGEGGFEDAKGGGGFADPSAGGPAPAGASAGEL